MTWLSLQQFRTIHETILSEISLLQASQHSQSLQWDMALDMAQSASYKIVHPLFIRRSRMPRRKTNAIPLSLIGLDVETNHLTGVPMLLGFAWDDHYQYLHKPSLEQFIISLREMRANDSKCNLVCWGNLDIQTIIRLFSPTEEERQRIGRGISAVVKEHRLVSAPISRTIGNFTIYISHYISGRSLRLGITSNGWNDEIWIFNLSQFYSARLPSVAKTFGLSWYDFPQDTHLIDWLRYSTIPSYATAVLQSNRQDAQTVAVLAGLLQQRFADVFHTYPTILVSPGSLTDAATSAMLSDADYAACSQQWLVTNVWRQQTTPLIIGRLETLTSEAYSAGYIDQFGIGYFPIVHTADIAAAYPSKIRALPDLRYSRLVESTNIAQTIQNNPGSIIWTAFIHGLVHIPPTLRFHPITIRTYMRENYRPTGDFRAAYTLQEREWCQAHGATFEEESGVFVMLDTFLPSPLASVSIKLGEMRDNILQSMRHLDKTSPDYAVFDGQQYLVKQVDNSSYGKTVMTIESVELVNSKPTVVGYITGDRFNQLYGTMITAQTRIQIADACMALVQNGSKPIMTMTDSIYWEGSATALPERFIRTTKTPGYFESVKTIHDMYLLKTGQYEYREGTVWTYKLRGIPIDRNTLQSAESVYRKTITEWCATIPDTAAAESIRIALPTRRLITIGRHDLDMLGAIVDGTTEIAPFTLTSKNVERDLPWRQLLDDHIWLATPHIEHRPDATPLALATQLYMEGFAQKAQTHRNAVHNDYERKKAYVVSMTQQTGKHIPPGRLNMISWRALHLWYGESNAPQM